MANVEVEPAEVATLLDEAACRRVLSRYGSALDWRDDDALASTIWPDAVVDYGFFKGSGEEYVHAFMEIERAAIRPFHILVCEQLEVKCPYAEAESLGIALTIEKAPDNTVTARQYWGRYLDQLHKRGKEWRISRRTYLVHGVFDVDIQGSAPGRLEGLHVAEDLTVRHAMYRAFR
jgi:hypothetical protein